MHLCAIKEDESCENDSEDEKKDFKIKLNDLTNQKVS